MSLFDNYDPSIYTAGLEDDSSIKGVVDMVRNEIDQYQDRVNLSITNFVKKLMIMSRVFIQNKICDDPALNDTLDCVQNQYLAFILAALTLNESIGNNRTIRKQMEVVATENYRSFMDISDSVFNLDFGMEDNSTRTKYGPYGGKDGNSPKDGKGYRYNDIRNYDSKELDKIAREDPDFYEYMATKEIERQNKRATSAKNAAEKEAEANKKAAQKEAEAAEREAEKEAEKRIKQDIDFRRKQAEKLRRDFTNASINDKTRELSLASGRIVEVMIGNKKINIPVQLLPTIISDDVAESFITLNFKPNWRQRLVQAKAGEISWIKDFIFEMDQIKKYKDALKKDKSGLLYEMKQRQKNAASDAVFKMLTDGNSQNIASTIFIFDKQSFMLNAKASGLNWRNVATRDKFFAATFSFMTVLIDPIYAKSEFYWAGIDAVGEYSAKQLKAASKKESYDLKDIMAAFTQGHSPRF